MGREALMLLGVLDFHFFHGPFSNSLIAFDFFSSHCLFLGSLRIF